MMNNFLIILLIYFAVLIVFLYFIKIKQRDKTKRNVDQSEGPPDDIYPLF